MPTSSTEAFDAIRAANPDLGFGLYALEPGGPVTLEIYTPDGAVYAFRGDTALDAISAAFPPAPEPVPSVASEVATDIFD